MGKGVLSRYPLSASGATFKAVQAPLLSCVDNMRRGHRGRRGGRIFVSSLVMAGNEASPVSRSEIIMITVRTTRPMPVPVSKRPLRQKKNFSLKLEDASWYRRSRATSSCCVVGKGVGREAAGRLASAAAGSPLQVSLLWLAAVGGETRKLCLRGFSERQHPFYRRFAHSAACSKDGNCGILAQNALSDVNPPQSPQRRT